MDNTYLGLQHWNGRALVCIAYELTDPDPLFGELCEITFIALDYKFDMVDHVTPLQLILQPSQPQNIRKFNSCIKRAMSTGIELEVAIDGFEQWMQAINMKHTKYGTDRKVMPMAWDFPILRTFLVKMFGLTMFEEFFHHDYRDIKAAATLMNDRAGSHGAPVPFSKLDRQWILCRYDEPNENFDTLPMAANLAKVYKRMCQDGIYIADVSQIR